MVKRVPTEKNRASTYLDDDKFKRFNQLADEDDSKSLSEWIEKQLDRVTQEGAIVITLPPEILKKLQQQSTENFRSLEDQARKIIHDWVNQENSSN